MNQTIPQQLENEVQFANLENIELVDIEDLQKAFLDKNESDEEDGFKNPSGAVRGTYGCGSGW